MEDVNAKLEIISNTLTDMGKQFKQIDQRFEQIDRRFEQIDRRFTELRTELKEDIANVETNLRSEISAVEANLRSEISAVERNLRDEMTALEHRTNVRFDELAAGQAQLAAGQAKFEANQADFKAQLTRLEERLFHEEGIRETQADVLYLEHKGDAKKLLQRVRDHEQRLRRLERQAAA